MRPRTWRSPDGILWVVDVDLPGSSNAMVLFYEPGGKSGQMDRYAWYISNGPEARSVTSRLAKGKVLESLTDADLERLYRRSMKVSRPDAIIGKSKLLG
ncbi:MAG TPA: hypothetical protein VGH04_01165 [Gemmatimonadaceae bacterium]|jgi:hypothetical protein